MLAQHSHVLIVGAGPVGMLAAVELARKGVEVAVVDQDEGTSVRSYACLLHPASVRLLEKAGAGDEVLARGIRIGQLELSENGASARELHPGGSRPDAATAVILPQSDLEEILQQRLSALGVEVLWRHRLTDLRASKERVTAFVDVLANSGKGYAVPHMDQVVSKSLQITADYLVGADGRDSHVREVLGIRQRFDGEPEYWAACEFEAAGWEGDDLHLALDSSGANMLARLPDGRARAMFQCAPEELDIESHLKERVRFRIVEPAHDTELLAEIGALLQARFPSVRLELGDIDWHGVMGISRCLATRFGGERCWLAGDAAHMSSPVGMHSMNFGLLEAAEIARAIADPYSEEETVGLLKKFNSDFHGAWAEFLATPDKRRRTIAEMLPASGPELAAMLAELELPSGLRRLEPASR
jgi:2-polyprenyl-6-methoxyphenol hydroxylase-like FAD-dependent oxidoreductase